MTMIGSAESSKRAPLRQFPFWRVTAATVVLACGLLGCAPEPGAAPPQEGDFTSEADRGESWPERSAVDEAPKTTEPPESFPLDHSLIPEGAVINDIGERSDTEWFAVLRAESTAAASHLLDDIVASGRYRVTEEGTTSEGERYASLEGNGVVVDALILAAADDSSDALLSLDIVQSE